MAVPEFAASLDLPVAACPDVRTDGHRLDSATTEAWLRWHGSQSSSYFSLQTDCRHFFREGRGFVPYVPVGQGRDAINLVFTNPVAAPPHRAGLLAEFERQTEGHPLYVGVDPSLAYELSVQGYRTTMMGTEFTVPLAGFQLKGRAMKQLRHASNLHRRQPVTVQEQTSDTLDLEEVQRVSRDWRQGKAVNNRELKVLTRPPVFTDEWGVRKFYAYLNGQLAAFVFFDPYFEQGRLKGYCANILRASPLVQPTGLLDYVILHAMDVFRDEGVAEVSLGIAPLHGVRPVSGDQPLLRWLQQRLYRHGNRLYAFAPLAYHKTRYRGRETPWFVCARNLSSITIAMTVLKGTGVLHVPRW